MTHAVTTTERQEKQSEKQEQAAIVQLIKSVGGQVWILGTRRPASDSHKGTCQTPGLPDIFAILPGRISVTPNEHAIPLWVEVKARGGRLRVEQEAFRVACFRANLPHLLGGVDVVLDWLRRGGWIK